MRGILRASVDRWRSTLTLLLLGGALVVVVLLGLEAWEARRHHRETAESVLRSYARLVADEFGRRTTSEIGYRGFYPIVTTLQQTGLPGPEGLPRRNGDVPQPRELVRTLFTLDPGERRLRTTGVPLDEETSAWLVGQLRASPPSSGGQAPMTGLRRDESSGQRIFISTPLPASPGGPGGAAGFEVDPEGLASWVRAAVDARPLIPQSLGDGDLSNDLLFLRLSDETGRVLYTSGRWPGSLLAVESPLGEAYGGIFDGLELQVCIDPAAASRLVIGGLPSSRLPVLWGLMLLTVGLIAAVIWQMRRERALSRTRSEFVARVSHELRTPLTQIRMFAETLLLDRARTEEERRRCLEIIDQEARRLSHLVANILQFSRAERGTVHLAPRPIALAPFLADVVEKFAPIASAKDARMSSALAPGIEVVADEESLRQIVLNLLDNAVKYGPPGQEVRLVLENGGRIARITVQDEGPGVPERDRERIWRRWQRLGRDERRAIAGTGIGLTVVRDLVALHGGSAWVESGPARGARFVVEIPLSGHGGAAE